MDYVIEEISEILKSSMGLDYNSIGISSVKNATKKRIEITGCADYNEYLDCLKQSDTELRALIENIVIPETWFFRDIKPYKILADRLKQIRANPSKAEKLYLLSLPSSTGEEPYSIAMTLLDCGWYTDEFQIDAYDISEVALKKAHNAIYTKNSFRVSEDDYIRKYFTQSDDLFFLDDTVKQCVSFHQGNMFDATAFPFIGKYDIIFCRNLIIYFDVETQANAFAVLSRLLKNDGLLILGHAETANASKGKFTLAENASAYAYTKSVNPASAVRKPARQQLVKNRAAPVHKPAFTRKPENPGHKAPVESTPLEAEEKIDRELFEHIKSLADNGEITSAIELCTGFIQDNQKDADANYLLAVLYDANGEIMKAEDYLRKAIYLNPEHVNAIIHMAVIAERNGDMKTAERMRLRARRVEERSTMTMDKMA